MPAMLSPPGELVGEWHNTKVTVALEDQFGPGIVNTESATSNARLCFIWLASGDFKQWKVDTGLSSFPHMRCCWT